MAPGVMKYAVDGVLPDLGFVRREAVLPESAVRGARLVPEGFAGRDAGPGRLPLGPHRVGISARRALERMDAAWPESEERMAKLSVNAMIGLWARSAEVLYSVRSNGVGPRLRCFLGAFKSGATEHQKRRRGAPPPFFSFFGRIQKRCH